MIQTYRSAQSNKVKYQKFEQINKQKFEHLVERPNKDLNFEQRIQNVYSVKNSSPYVQSIYAKRRELDISNLKHADMLRDNHRLSSNSILISYSHLICMYHSNKKQELFKKHNSECIPHQNINASKIST